VSIRAVRIINIRDMKVCCFIVGWFFIVFILAIREIGASHVLSRIRGVDMGSVAKVRERLCQRV